MARVAVSTFRYVSLQEPRTALRQRIREIAQVQVRYSYRKILVLLNREGWKVGKKLVYRLYREEGLTLRSKPKKAALCGAESPRANQRGGAESGVELGFRGRSTGRRAALSCDDGDGCIYPRRAGD